MLIAETFDGNPTLHHNADTLVVMNTHVQFCSKSHCIARFFPVIKDYTPINKTAL